MSSYWIDTDTLVWANNNAFPLNSRIGAEFWRLMEEGFESGLIKMPRRVYLEITKGREKKDDLALWLERRSNVSTPSSKEVQEFAVRIATHLYSDHPRYEMRHINAFASGADAWLIAHAAVDRGAVVSREIPQPDAKKPKIPDICEAFQVKRVHWNKFTFCLEHEIPADRCTDPYSS